MQAIDLQDLTANNSAVFRRINSVVLPTRYSDKWYRESLEVGELAKLGTFNGIPVGAVRAGLETNAKNSALPTQVYIMTLAVLAPYRGFGLGSLLIEHICTAAKQLLVSIVYVHVLATDEEALAWYQHRGFTKDRQIEGYYRSMKPPADAWVMVRRV